MPDLPVSPLQKTQRSSVLSVQELFASASVLFSTRSTTLNQASDAVQSTFFSLEALSSSGVVPARQSPTWAFTASLRV